MTKQQSAIARGLLTPEQVANEIGVRVGTILDWLRAGKLTGYRFNKRVVRVKSSDLAAFIEGRKI